MSIDNQLCLAYLGILIFLIVLDWAMAKDSYGVMDGGILAEDSSDHQ